MRQAGVLSNRNQADRLADYLLTQDISVRVEPEGDAWAIWVRDEDKVPQAVEELQRFLADPDAPRYREAATAAADVRKEQARVEQQRRKNMIDMRERWGALPRGGRPLTIMLIAASIFVSLVTDFGSNNSNGIINALFFQPPPTEEADLQTWTPIQKISEGQVWRLVTPIFIHFNWMHLLFNMIMLYQFGSLIEVRRGSLIFGLMVLAIAVASNYGQYFFSTKMLWGEKPLLVLPGGPFVAVFGGMSGVVYGLFGYLWMKSKFDPASRLYIHPNTVLLLIIWLFLCWFGIFGSIANWAHTVGLAVGAAIGYAPVAWRKLRK
jgi:GlpG protein